MSFDNNGSCNVLSCFVIVASTGSLNSSELNEVLKSLPLSSSDATALSSATLNWLEVGCTEDDDDPLLFFLFFFLLFFS